MQTIVYDRYGSVDVLELRSMAPPQGRGLRVAVHRAALNPKDALFRKGKFRGISGRRFPKRCGLDFAGDVLEGPGFAPGARVFGSLEEWRFLRGTLAQEVVVQPQEVARLPVDVSYEAGASLALVGLTSLQALRDIARVQPGSRVLINGASGGVGTAATQIARVLGGVVTTLSSDRNRSLCAELGASTTLDYTADEVSAHGPFDVVFDVYGNLGMARARPLLAPGGTFVSTVPSVARFARDLVARALGGQERLVVVRSRRADLDQIAAWLREGALRAVIDRRVALSSVQEGFRHLESRRARGKIIVEIDHGR